MRIHNPARSKPASASSAGSCRGSTGTRLALAGVLAAAVTSCATSSFDTADLNNDSAIASSEFDAYMKAEVFNGIDANSDGQVTLAEWRVVNPKVSQSKFNGVDSNGDGVVTRAEADAASDRSGNYKKLFDHIDKDGNGTLSRAETDAFKAELDQVPGGSNLQKLSHATSSK